MYLTVFKTYTKELALQSLTEKDFLEDKNIVNILKKGLNLYMGDGEDEVLRTNWKLYCHLLQAITAYIQSKMLQLNKQCRVEKDVIKEIFECSETALSSIRCDSLKSKLTEVQFTSILTSFVEGMLSLALELETQPDFKGAGFPALSVLLQRLMTRALQHPMVHNIILNKLLKHMRGKRSSEKTLVRVAVTQLFDCLPAVGATACELPPSKAVPGAGVGGKGKKKAEVATILPTGTAGALLVDFCKDDAQLSVLALLVLECTLSAIPPDPSQNVASGELRGLWRSLHCHCSQHSQQCQPESASSSSDAGTALAQCLGELAGVLGGNSKDCSNSNPSQPPCSLAIANKLQDVYSSCGSRTGADLLAPPAAVAELLSSVPLLLTLCCIGIDGTSTGKMSEVSTASMSLISEKELSAALRKAIAATVREISPSPRSQDSTTKSIDAKAYIFRSIAQSATMLLTSLKGNKVQYSAFAVSLISAAGELLPPIPRDDMCTHETASGCCSSADAALLVRTFRAVYSLLPYIDAPLISPALLCSAGGDLQRLLYHVSRGGDSNGDAASLSPSTAGNAELEVRYTVGTICSLLARCCAIPQFPVVSQASLSEAVSEALAVAEERSALHSLASALSRSIALCSSVVAALGPDNSSGSNQRLSAQASSQQRDQAALLSRVLVALLLRCSLENGGEECQATTTAATAVAATPFSFNTPGYLDSLLPNGENPVAAVTAAAAQVLSSFNCRVAFALGDLPGAGAGHISGTALLENVLAINRHLYRSSSTAVSAAPEVDVSITALYLRSQLHFCNVSVLSPSEQAAVEAQIREKLLSLDRSEYEATVSQLQAKSSAKTAIASKARKAASAEKIVDVADQVLKGSEALRLLCLLCAWNSHSASVAAFGDCSGSLGNSGKFSDLAVSSRDSSSGGSDSGKLVTAAVKVLKRLLSLLSSVTDHHQHASSLSSLCEVVVVNARPLMLQLYALGRTEDMAVLLNFARALEGHAQKNAPELSAAVQELCTFHSVTLVFSGVFTKVEKLALSSYYAISAPRTATNPTATTTAAATACNPVDLLCLTSIALLQPQDSHIADLLAQQFTADNQAQLPSDKTEYIVRVKQAYAFAASQRKKRLADGTLTCVSLDFLAFICALCSKVLFLCYQDLQGSLEWGTYARSAADSPGNAVSPWLSGGASAFVAQSAVLEVLLVRADVYEVLGNVDSCLAYAREASALASNRLRSPPLQKVVLLHTMRLWHRTASSRLCGLLSELLEYTEQIYSSEEDRSDVMTRQVRQAAKCLNDIFLLAPDEVQQGDEAGGIIGDINYRHMHYYWDTAAVATEEGEPPANAYNCPMPPSERILIRAALNSPPAPPSPSPLFGGICSSLNAKNSCSEGFDEEACALRALLERASAVQGVDVVRALRRRYCLRLATAAPPASTPAAARKTPTAGDLQLNSQLMAFLAGASSCGVALERLAEIKNENISATDTDGTKNGGALSPSPTEPPLLFNFGCMTGAADCVNRAVLGDPHCVKLVLDKVRTMLQPSHHSSAGDPSHCVIAFACLESASGALILGRLDAGSSLVVSLPVHQQLQNLLNKWDDAQEISRAMLRQGVNAEQVAALTEKQKKQWWSSRQQHDAEVEAMLSDLQDLLGPWRVLLSTEPVRCELVDTCCAIFSKHGPTTSSCSHPGKDRSTVATALAQWAALLLSNTRHTSTPCDGTLISRIMPLTAVEVQAGLTALLRQSGFPEDRLQAAVQELTLCASAAAGDTEQLAATSPTSGHLAPAVDEPFFSAAAPDPHTSEAELNSLKVAELRSLLKDTGLDITGKKQDLVQRMLEHLRQQTLSQQNEGADASSGVAQAKMASSEDTTNADTGHLVLILDEQLQRFPFESMPALRRASCSRVPSFALLLKLMNSSTKIDQATSDEDGVCDDMGNLNISSDRRATEGAPKKSSSSSTSKKPGTITTAAAATAKRKGKIQVNKENISPQDAATELNTTSSALGLWRKVAIDKCWYALDIEGNLPNTRSTLQPFLRPYEEQWLWKAVVATIPSEQATQGLHESSELFIFCGHGAGEQMCDPFRFRRLRTCPAALLWGCSSGRLRAMGVHDALGTAVYYLLAGSPCVVANLWDVTDKDIDKLCMAHMQLCFDGAAGAITAELDSSSSSKSGSSKNGAVAPGKEDHQELKQGPTGGVLNVSTALAMSRGVCRMQFAVGAAPVVYGIPVSVGKPVPAGNKTS